MNFTMTKIAAAAVLALAASGAQAVTVTGASVTGGNFEMIGFGAPITFANFGTGSANMEQVLSGMIFLISTTVLIRF